MQEADRLLPRSCHFRHGPWRMKLPNTKNVEQLIRGIRSCLSGQLQSDTKVVVCFRAPFVEVCLFSPRHLKPVNLAEPHTHTRTTFGQHAPELCSTTVVRRRCRVQSTAQKVETTQLMYASPFPEHPAYCSRNYSGPRKQVSSCLRLLKPVCRVRQICL